MADVLPGYYAWLRSAIECDLADERGWGSTAGFRAFDSPDHRGQSADEGSYAAGAPELAVEISHTTERETQVSSSGSTNGAVCENTRSSIPKSGRSSGATYG